MTEPIHAKTRTKAELEQALAACEGGTDLIAKRAMRLLKALEFIEMAAANGVASGGRLAVGQFTSIRDAALAAIADNEV